jgi:PAS domain S-box-containing protein
MTCLRAEEIKARSLVTILTGLRLLLTVSALYFLCTAAPAAALEQVTLQLKWMHQFQFAGYYAAVQQGYYREAGLNVTIVPATPGKDPVQEVLNGKADYGVGTSSLLLLRNAGKPVVALAVIFQHSPFILLTKELSTSQTVHSLVGKRLMLEPLSEELTAYLRKEGLPLEKMQMMEHSFNLKDLINGNVDAVSGYITTDPDDLNRAGFPFHAYTPRSAGIDFYGDNLFTTENELKNHPARAKAFREASLKGWHYALGHPDEIIELILSTYIPPGLRADRAHLKYEAEEIRKLIQPDLVEIGYMHSGRWRHIADTYNELGMLPKNIDLKKFMYDPHPQKNLTPFYWVVAALLGSALLMVAARLKKTSQSLKSSEEQVLERTAALLEAKLLSEQIIISAQEGVVVYDRDLRYQVWNPYMERLTDLPAADVLGSHPLKFFPFMQESGMIERLENMLIDGIPGAIDFPYFVPSTGVSGWASNMSAPLRDAQEKIIGIIATVRDITEKRLIRRELLDKQKRLEDSHCELETQLVESQAIKEELTVTLESLQNSLSYNRGLIEANLDALLTIDSDGNITDVNSATENVTGYVRQHLIGSCFFYYFTDSQRAQEVLKRVFSEGVVRDFALDIRHRDGHITSVLTSASLYHDESGNVLGVFVSARDITEQELMVEALRKSEELFHSLVETSQDLIWRCDVEGRFTYLNLAWEHVFGFELSEMLGKKFTDFQTQADGERDQRKFDLLMNGEPIDHYETIYRGLMGNEIHLVFNALSLFNENGEISGASGTAFDITQRKQMEEELRSSKAAAEQANISKSQFLSNMSHEIRTPLNAIIGFSTLMLKSTLPASEHDFIKKINTAGETLLNVINDILDFSKIEVGQLNLEQIPFMLKTVLTTAVNMVQHKATDKDLPLLIKTLPGIAPCLIGDPLRLGQVIVNLLNNAVKFTEQGVVTLEATLLKEENDLQQLTFTIHDTGIGILPEQIATLFLPFTQADESTTRRFGGTGLGLSICKQIVELME